MPNVVKAQPIDELRRSVIRLVDYMDANKESAASLCARLIQAITEFGRPYMKPRPGQDKNVVFIPCEDAPVVMITTCIPITEDAESVIGGLRRFADRCGEFSEPMEDIVSEAEMDLVLDAAQKKFGVLDIVALFNPLKILSLHNTHRVFDCECGISDGYHREAVIFVYHPRNVSVHDKVYIFAHELGHALHLGLTGDVNRIPERFDVFNESLGIKEMTLHEKQESFADAAAIAILNNDGLREHLPGQLSERLPPYFEKYIKYVTDAHFKKLGWRR